MRDLKISKIQAELLASRLQGGKLLQQGVKVPYRKRQQLLSFFVPPKDGELVYCNDVGLLQELGCTHNPKEWRLCRFV